MKTLTLAAVILYAALAIASTQAQREPTYAPSAVKVAIIPTLNTSGEKWEELKQRQCQRGDEYLAKEFGKRGFQVVPMDLVRSALEKLKVDFTDEEQQKRATLFEVGKEVGADVVIFAIVTHTDQRLIQQILSAKREGKATLKVWLLDVPTQYAFLSAKTIEGKSGGGFFAGLDKGSDRQIIAVENGLRDVLKPFFKPYPAPKDK